MRRFTIVLLGVALAGLAPSGARSAIGDPESQVFECGDRPSWTPHRTVEGTFDSDDQGSYVLVPFDVPPGTSGVRVRLAHDAIQFENPVTKHTLDLGLYEPGPDDVPGAWEFRGWGGSSRLDACVAPDEATVGFLPGPVPAGTWKAEIGVAAVAGPDEGDPDGEVAWTLQVDISAPPAHTGTPWRPAAYDETPADPEPGWYAGDFHVHAEHSNDNDASMRRTFDYAFAPLEAGGAGLDFITLSDYVTTRHWHEIGRFQPDYPGRLIVRSAEVITYRGHINNHASERWADYRTGPVYEWRDGEMVLLRDPVAPGAEGGILDTIRDGDSGWTQVNHPTIFPATVPAFGNLCRGCSWEYSDDETDWAKVDAMEVQTGPAGTYHVDEASSIIETDAALGPNPFTPAAIEWFDRLQRLGYDLTAVGSSDSHHADHQELTQSPIGEASTVVYAKELSEAGVRDAVLAGHAYVKFFGNHGPDLRFTARPSDGGSEVIMGDALEASAARFRAEVLGGATGPGPLTLVVMRDGFPFLTFPVTGDPFEVEFDAVLPGDYRLQLHRGTAIEAMTNPINLRSG